jgi:hypothetical protein
MAKLRLLRIHRSTVFLICALTVLLVAANLYHNPAPPKLKGYACGFPIPMFKNWQPITKPNTVATVDETYVNFGPFRFHFGRNGWCYSLLFADIAICLAVMLIVAVVWEFFLRRKPKAA